MTPSVGVVAEEVVIGETVANLGAEPGSWFFAPDVQVPMDKDRACTTAQAIVQVG